MLRRIYKELVAIKEMLQAIRKDLEQQKEDESGRRVSKLILYANNEIYRQELRISLSNHDWYKLQKKPFYQDLMRYVDNLQKGA